MSGGEVAVENLSLRLGAFALRAIDLHVATGEILVLLGPNGAGKSVLLETMAGFHRPDKGRVAINGRDVTHLAPEQRRVGLVFQDFGLFPHLTVARNVAIGLQARHSPRAGGRGGTPRDVPAWLDYFGITHLAERDPRGLSAGEKQRASLARAFATDPDLFLFDEPFSALDARTRDHLREDLGRFLRDAAVPAIFVTHDHIDARALADRIAVIKQGALIQQGSQEDIFCRPASRFVADFVGVENVLVGRIEGRVGDRLRVAIGKNVLYARNGGADRSAGNVTLCIRAEEVRLRARTPNPADEAGDVNRLAARVIAVTNLGALTRIGIDCGFALTAYVMSRDFADSGLVPGTEALADIKLDAIHLADCR